MYDGQPEWQPIGAHVQETADAETDQRDGEDLARSGQTPIAIVRHEGEDGEGKVYRPGHDEGGLPLRRGDRVVYINTRKDT